MSKQEHNTPDATGGREQESAAPQALSFSNSDDDHLQPDNKTTNTDNSNSGQDLPIDVDRVAGDDELVPEFRVVLVAQKRRGIRLEKLYWRLLNEIAFRRGKKRSRLVASIVEQDATNSKNIASILRGFVSKTLDEERQTSVGNSSTNSIIDLLQQAPVPAFAISRLKKLSKVNPEFMQFLRVMTGNLDGKVSADFVHLTLDTPTEQLFKQLEDRPSVHCNYLIQLDDRKKRGRIKVIAVPPSPHKLLVGYIVS